MFWMVSWPMLCSVSMSESDRVTLAAVEESIRNADEVWTPSPSSALRSRVFYTSARRLVVTHPVLSFRCLDAKYTKHKR